MAADDLLEQGAPAEQPGFHRPLRKVERARRLLQRHPLDVDQDEGRPVVVGDPLQRLTQQTGPLGSLGDGMGGGAVVGEGRRDLLLLRLPAAAAAAIEGGVDGDAVEPGRQGVLRLVAVQTPEDLEEHLAGHVLDLLARDSHPEGGGGHQPLVPVDQNLEPLDPPRQDLTDQLDIRGLAGHPPSGGPDGIVPGTPPRGS